MKAIFFEQHGEIDVLKYADLPDPRPGAGQALIKVHAVALNHLDIWVRKGWAGLKLGMPHIGGSDIAGEIVEVNPKDANFSKGTKVVINPGVNNGEDEWTRRGEDSLSPGYKLLGEQLRGGMAEYVIVPIENVFKIPDGIPYEEAAAPILVTITAWRMLFRRARVQPGETVLIVGAGGGVNSMTIQLARSAGAEVFALTSSKEKANKARELGASEVIDYTKVANWPSEILKITKGRGVDVVVDNVGQATYDKSVRALTRGGRLVTVGNTSGHDLRLDNRLIFTKQISILGSTMGSRQDFIDSMHYIWSRGIKPVIDRVEHLEDGIKMIKHLESGKQFGKIVLRV